MENCFACARTSSRYFSSTTLYVLAARLIRRVQRSRSRHHGQIDSARPACRCLFAHEMELLSDDVPAHEQPNCFTRAWIPARRAKLTFRSGQNVIDLFFHRPKGNPASRPWQNG